MLDDLAIGKIANGSIKQNDELVCINEEGNALPLKISKLQVYDGINFKDAESVMAGDIAILAGIEDVHIGDTICNKGNPKALKRIAVDEPTISMLFFINTSPLSGKEGKIVQSNKIQRAAS